MSLEINLAGRIAMVTGGGQGIGEGCALSLARAGAGVIVMDRNEQAGQAVAATVRQLGGEGFFVAGDVCSEASVRAALEKVAERYREVHVLVNNAGVNLFKALEETSPDEWDRVVGVDLKGVYLVTRACLPLLKAAGGASVINIASVHATLTIAGIAAYAAAKGGVVSMTRSLCQELGPHGIRVNAVSPGFVMTPLLQDWIQSTPDPAATMVRVNSYHPTGRIGTPEDIGNLVAFLASPMAGFITGAHYIIDGGLTARLMH